MSRAFIQKGPPNHFPKGLKAEPVESDKFRLTLNASFARVGAQFTRAEVEEIVSHLQAVLQTRDLVEYNHAPTKETINIEDEESRA